MLCLPPCWQPGSPLIGGRAKDKGLIRSEQGDPAPSKEKSRPKKLLILYSNRGNSFQNFTLDTKDMESVSHNFIMASIYKIICYMFWGL